MICLDIWNIEQTTYLAYLISFIQYWRHQELGIISMIKFVKNSVFYDQTLPDHSYHHSKENWVIRLQRESQQPSSPQNKLIFQKLSSSTKLNAQKRGNDYYFVSREVTLMKVQDKTLNNNVEDLTTAVNQMNGNLILMIKDRLDCIPGNLLSSCPPSSAGTSPIHAIRVRNNKLWSQDIFTWVLR